MKISAVVSAYNEEKLLGDCLKSLKDLADEIILVDNSSQDRTANIAKKYTPKIFTVANDPVMLNKNKNFGFTKATGDWIISIDADERITTELAKEIKKAIKSKGIVGFEIPRKNIIFNKWIQHSIWWPDYNLRLFRRGSGKFPLRHVHEKLKVSGKVAKLENPIEHLNYQTISQYIRKLDGSYTESEVEIYIKSGKNISWYDAMRFPVADFIQTFFLQKGYKDGMHGLVLSILQSFYAFIVFAKIWERKENFKDLTPDNFLLEFIKETKKLAKDFKYWIYTSQMEESKTKKLYFKILRKFR